MQEVIAYLSTHGFAILAIIGMAISLGQAIVALTPTKKDDSFMMRVAKIFDKITGFIPNVKRKEGTLVKPDGLHPKKQ